MQYRIHPKTGDKISVIGIGTGPIFVSAGKGSGYRSYLRL